MIGLILSWMLMKNSKSKMCFKLACEVKYHISILEMLLISTMCTPNMYNMPFATFVGINHDGPSIILGASLISSEDTSVFI